MYSFPNKEGASVESFPTAFAIPIGLVKLVQGLWLLDHNDQQVHADFGSRVLPSGTISDSWKCNNYMVLMPYFFILFWLEFIWAAPTSSCLSVSVWVAAWTSPAGANVPRPALVGPSLLSLYKAADFLHIPGQALLVCPAAKQVRWTEMSYYLC